MAMIFIMALLINMAMIIHKSTRMQRLRPVRLSSAKTSPAWTKENGGAAEAKNRGKLNLRRRKKGTFYL